MTCREFADFMADYRSGDLPLETLREFERHLDLCVNCRKYLEGYEATIRLGKAAFADQDAGIPADVPEELVRAILAARSRRA